ncbi:MAG TPA: glycosyltransferase 87 family protein [Gaiellales bacterium]|nr:glycosyltransferase 87 family protein [Gaiellales bacterium]
MRRNLAIVLAFAVLHAGAALAYHADGKDLPATYFYPRAHAIANGTKAYSGLDYEYPPATLPLLVAPLAAGGDHSGQAYHQRTIWLYGALDVVCVLLLASLLRRRPSGELLLALGLYSVTVLVLGRLALTRFDLAAGLAILLAGRYARSPGRAGAWLGLAGALKLVPLAAAPAMTRRGTTVRLLVAAAAVPVAVQIAYFLWSGEVGLSWIGYHAGRDPEIESWAAVLADGARAFGAHAGTAFDHGSQNVTGTSARWLGRVFALASVGLALLLARQVRRVDADPALSLLAALGVLIAVAPVLSPQYLLWVAPLSALLAPRYPLQAVMLALSSVLTRLELNVAFDDLPHFHWGAIAILALRNAALAGFAIVLWRAAIAPGSGTPTRTAWPGRS